MTIALAVIGGAVLGLIGGAALVFIFLAKALAGARFFH